MKGLYTYHSGKNEENLFETRELTKDFVARAAKNA